MATESETEGRDDSMSTAEVQKRLQLGGFDVVKVSEKTDWAKLLIYGVPGAGKTFLAGEAAAVERMSPVLFIDIEGGTKTIRNLYPDIDVVRVKDVIDPKTGRIKVHSWKKLQDVYEDIRKGELAYKTIVVDSLSEAQKVSMLYAVSESIRTSGRDRDPDVPEMRDWGKSGEQIRRFVRAFRDLDCHVIFTALAADVKDQTTGTVTVKPALPGKVADEIPAYLDEVLYLYCKSSKDGVERKILTEPNGKYIAKDRSGRLPTVVNQPTMATLAEAILD
jgi:hypothetical protein